MVKFGDSLNNQHRHIANPQIVSAHFMKTIIQTICFLLCINGFSQDTIPHLKPSVGGLPDLSIEAQKRIACRDSLMSITNRTADEEAKLQTLLNEFNEVQENIWDIIGGGCSWYCGGGPYKVTGSSMLDTNYRPEYAHDLNFKNVWAEGAKDYGINEYLTYYFGNKSPRINEIVIFNGYTKTEKLWENNSRVKQLKLYVNDQLFAYLDLENDRQAQSFKVPLLGHRSDGKDLILKFVIADIYPGKKFKDTVITEIYFDGIDVH